MRTFSCFCYYFTLMTTPFSPPFPPSSYADWLAQVQKDLKDSSVYESLRWSSPDGFTVEPYYSATGIEPQQLESLQNAQKSTPGWLNSPEYIATAGEEKDLNARLRSAITNGADALLLNVPAPPDASVNSPQGVSLPRLLDGIKLSDTPVFFRLAGSAFVSPFLQTLRQVAPYQLRGGILAASGTLPAHELIDAYRQSSESPNFRTIGVSSHEFHTAGATATQELAFTLARLAETYDHLTKAGMSIGQLVPKTMLSVSVGTSYFMEMAKLRALRVLVARLLPITTSQPILLHCQTSTFYEAKATPYTNLLRATTEAMAAVIGGADALTVRPYDAVLGTSPGEFSERIARNVSTLLKAESYLDKVADPAAGSYYIENLTHQLTEAAWSLFQQVQDMGGFTKALAAGYVQQELDKAYQEKIAAVENGRVLVGVTKFRHDEAPAIRETDKNSATPTESSTGMKAHRLAESFE